MSIRANEKRVELLENAKRDDYGKPVFSFKKYIVISFIEIGGNSQTINNALTTNSTYVATTTCNSIDSKLNKIKVDNKVYIIDYFKKGNRFNTLYLKIGE